MKAYVLVKFAAGADLDQARHALQDPSVKSIEMLIGPYDALVSVEAPDLAGIGEASKRLRSCPGLRDSMTCPVI